MELVVVEQVVDRFELLEGQVVGEDFLYAGLHLLLQVVSCVLHYQVRLSLFFDDLNLLLTRIYYKNRSLLIIAFVKL